VTLLRQIRPIARFLRFWHTLIHMHCAIDIYHIDGSITITCQCGKVWGEMSKENQQILDVLNDKMKHKK
jgi:hypothetical protein